MRIAQKPVSPYGCDQQDAEDAVQEVLAALWERGKHWSEGRIVLELMNQIRRVRRKQAVRQHLNEPMERHHVERYEAAAFRESWQRRPV